MRYLLKEVGKVRFDSLVVDQAPFFSFVDPFLRHE